MSGTAYRAWSRFIHRFNYHHTELSAVMSDMNRDIAVVASAHCYDIRQLHQQSGSYCRECNRIYPCPTIQILDGRGRS